MPIQTKLATPARAVPKATRRPVNEYAGLGRGLQQLGQGLSDLTTAQWRLHVSNESARLKNWLGDQMGLLEIESIKNHRNPDDQLAAWREGVKGLKEDASQMYDHDELMRNRWRHDFESKRYPGEHRIIARRAEHQMEVGINVANAQVQNAFHAYNRGDKTFGELDNVITGTYGNLVDKDVLHPAQATLRITEARNKLVELHGSKNSIAFLKAGALNHNGSLPPAFQGSTNQANANRQLAQGAAVKSYVEGWDKATPDQKRALASQLYQASGRDLSKMVSLFGGEHQAVLEKVAVLQSLPPNQQKFLLHADAVNMQDLKAQNLEAVQEINIASETQRPAHVAVIRGLPKNRNATEIQGELAIAMKKRAAYLLVSGRVKTAEQAVQQARETLFPYEVLANGAVIPKGQNYSQTHKDGLVAILNQKRDTFVKAQVGTPGKGVYKADVMADFDVLNRRDALRWVLVGDVYYLAHLKPNGKEVLIKETKTSLKNDPT